LKASFEDLLPQDKTAPEVISSNVDRKELSQLAISRYLEEPYFDNTQLLVEKSQYQPEPDEELDSDDALDDIKITAESDRYREFILKTPAFSWLVASLQAEANLTRATPDLMEGIRGEILGALPSSHKVSRNAPSQVYKARFELDWDPLSFVEQQQYIERSDKALERAITITGCANDAQSLTTREYLCQTWPATGGHVMRLVTDVVRNITDHYVACEYATCLLIIVPF
jgi:hypothetical protein